MLTEAINRLLELRRPETFTAANGVEFFAGTKQAVLRPEPETLRLNTLDGLMGYIESSGELAGIGSDPFIVVDDVDSVQLFLKAKPEDMRRRLVAAATYDRPDHFRFNHWYELEDFKIRLQAEFAHTDDRATILQILGNVTSEIARTEEDDGVSQTLSVRAGVTLKERQTILNPVKLAPYRTFAEVQPPTESNFVLRVKGGEMKLVALFEADGGMWRIETMECIRLWLKTSLSSIDLDNLPVL